MRRRHNEKPMRRENPDGRIVWVARYTNHDGRRVVVKPRGTFDLRGPCRAPREDGSCCAQHAIWAAYERLEPTRVPDTVGEYAKTWTRRHPRSERTNRNYNHRLGRVLDVELDGRRFRDWPLADVRRRQVNALVDELLTVQGRAHKGALGILRVCSAMWQDAIDDEVVEANPFFKPRLKASDHRIVKPARAVRVWTFEQMHDFARAAAAARTTPELNRWRGTYAEAMVRVLSDGGLRLGELLALYHGDLHDGVLEVRRTAYRGRLLAGTKTDHGEASAGRPVPVPPSLAELLAGLPTALRGELLLFPAPRGGVLQETPFYRDLWRPAREVAGIAPTPHEFRHGWVSHLRAAGIDPADLAAVSGHTVETATKHYTHALNRSAPAIRAVIG